MPRPWEIDISILNQQVAPDNWHFKLALPLLAPSCAQHLATLSYTFAQSFSFNHLQAKSTCLKKRSKHRNSGRIPSLIGSLTPAHGRLSRNMINNFCKRIISHPVKSQYLLRSPSSLSKVDGQNWHWKTSCLLLSCVSRLSLSTLSCPSVSPVT